MKTLRIVTGAIGTIPALATCGFAALLLALRERSSEGNPTFAVAWIAFTVIGLAGPFALFMSATLSEGQFTRGNRRLLLICLALGIAPTLVALPEVIRSREALLTAIVALTVGCLAVVSWCVKRKNP